MRCCASAKGDKEPYGGAIMYVCARAACHPAVSGEPRPCPVPCLVSGDGAPYPDTKQGSQLRQHVIGAFSASDVRSVKQGRHRHRKCRMEGACHPSGLDLRSGAGWRRFSGGAAFSST